MKPGEIRRFTTDNEENPPVEGSLTVTHGGQFLNLLLDGEEVAYFSAVEGREGRTVFQIDTKKLKGLGIELHILGED